jgi:uncharacterized protein
MSTLPAPADAATGFHLMAKPIGALCNLDCDYCFYLEKENFYPERERFRMPDEVLEAYVRNYVASQPTPVVEFTWQGGEPTLMGLEFFERAMAFQRKHADGKEIRNTLQTNATLINEDWARFLARERFLVGISLDGPQELHDLHRMDKQGRSSFADTLRGLRLLQQHHVEFNVLVTISSDVAAQPLQVYRYLKSIGVRYMQFNPVVERQASSTEQTAGLFFAEPPNWKSGKVFAQPALQRHALVPLTPQSVEPQAYGDFLIAIYDHWVRNDVGDVHVVNFDWALASWCQVQPGVCLFSPECGKAAIVEHDGSVYSCDHFMYPEYRLGNIQEDSVQDMMQSQSQLDFGAAKASTLPQVCQRCTYRFACHGECPKNRFTYSADGEYGLNYLCPSYLKYFRHITPTMNAMAKLLAAGQPASLIKEAFKGPLIVKKLTGIGPMAGAA